jgi:broad specificity phosphatase PhoE
MPRLYYVRHGLTDWNAAGRLQGRLDVPLNSEGRTQAARCGAILCDLFACDNRQPEALDYVSSPLGRARVTMELMRGALGLPPESYRVDERLAEISFGEWEGLTYQDVLARDPDVVARREGSKWGFLPPGGESYIDVARRVSAWYGTITTDTVVTAHGGTGRALIAFLKIAPQEEAVHYPIDQGVVYVFAEETLGRFA